ncbi:hypothetical protein OS493_026558, partial [Desmophyllum pertusum]
VNRLVTIILNKDKAIKKYKYFKDKAELSWKTPLHLVAELNYVTVAQTMSRPYQRKRDDEWSDPLIEEEEHMKSERKTLIDELSDEQLIEMFTSQRVILRPIRKSDVVSAVGGAAAVGITLITPVGWAAHEETERVKEKEQTERVKQKEQTEREKQKEQTERVKQKEQTEREKTEGTDGKRETEGTDGKRETEGTQKREDMVFCNFRFVFFFMLCGEVDI